jgi:hypothetical protein
MAGHLFVIRERLDMYVPEEWMVSFSGGRLLSMDAWVVPLCRHGPYISIRPNITMGSAIYDDESGDFDQFPWYDIGTVGFHHNARYVTRTLFRRSSDPLV